MYTHMYMIVLPRIRSWLFQNLVASKIGLLPVERPLYYRGVVI